MTISRTHLAGLKLTLKELGEHGFKLKAHAGYHLMPLIAQAQAAPEAEPVATVCGSGVQWIQPQAGRLANLAPLYANPPAPQHDAELVELMAAMRRFTLQHDSGAAGVLRGTIDAKLATLSANP